MTQLYISLVIAIIRVLFYPDNSIGHEINCRGSGHCLFLGIKLHQLADAVCDGPPAEASYDPGTKIVAACNKPGGIAVFTRNTKHQIRAGVACKLLNELVKHGCGACGSIPIGFLESGDDVSVGQLIVDYVNDC